MRFVHAGKGKVLKFDDVALVAPASEGPAVSRGFKLDPTKFRAKREFITAPRLSKGNSYQAGPLMELGHDQCRYTINDHGLMCGKHGFPWCEDHKKNVWLRYQR